MKKRSQIFEYNPLSPLRQGHFEIPSPDGQTFDPPREMSTGKGPIVFFRAYNDHAGSYGVVPGWVVSKPRKAPGRNTLLIRVIPLTTREKKNYRNRLRKVIATPKIIFW